MSVLSSPSPTLSPKPSFHHAQHHDRSSVGLRNFRSRPYTSSPSLRHHSHASSPAQQIQYTPTQQATRSPAVKAQKNTVDVGTQYTPPDYPPTAFRPMSAPQSASPKDARLSGTVEEAVQTTENPSSSTVVTEPPPEPALRDDPQPHASLSKTTSNVSNTTRPSRTSQSASPEDITVSNAELGRSASKSSKRSKGEPAAIKYMPADYMKTDVRDLGTVIADMLMELVRINDPLPFKNEQLTRFHSRAPPGISVHDYLNRLIVHATLYPPILLAMVYYIDRLCVLYPIFTISSLTVHRFLITAATVAAKGLSDSFWTNTTYARVGGISVKELALLELDFLQRMDWKIIPPADILNSYYSNLVERADGYAIGEPETMETMETGETSETSETER